MNDLLRKLKNIGGEVIEWMYFEGLGAYTSYRTRYNNGFGASIVCHPGSYGFEDGLYELAVIKWKNDKFHLTYDTPITDDVLGFLEPEDVIKICKKIKALEKDEEENV